MNFYTVTHTRHSTYFSELLRRRISLGRVGLLSHMYIYLTKPVHMQRSVNVRWKRLQTPNEQIILLRPASCGRMKSQIKCAILLYSCSFLTVCQAVLLAQTLASQRRLAGIFLSEGQVLVIRLEYSCRNFDGFQTFSFCQTHWSKCHVTSCIFDRNVDGTGKSVVSMRFEIVVAFFCVGHPKSRNREGLSLAVQGTKIFVVGQYMNNLKFGCCPCHSAPAWSTSPAKKQQSPAFMSTVTSCLSGPT